MAERKYKVLNRVDSAEVQGEGSFVLLKRPSWSEMRKYMEGKIDAEDLTVYGKQYLQMTVLDWNWVDDNGNPLPKPSDNPDVIDQLSIEESTFLMNALSFERKDPKNSDSG
jgi:hypothetical protein